MAVEAPTSVPQQWVKPSSRPEHIEQLISGVDRYNPQNLAVLTEYLEQQLQKGEYDCLANLAILKLFQFNPQEFDYSVVVSILIKALTAAPLPDFNLCLSLLGEAPVSTLPSAAPPLAEDATDADKEEASRVAREASSVPTAGNLTDPLIVKLATLSAFLLSARFRQFWKAFHSKEYDDVRESAKVAQGFEDDVRRVALDSVKVAFRTISAKRLAEYLNLSEGELSAFIGKQAGWSLNGAEVRVPPNPDNDVKSTMVREDVQLDQLTKLLSQSQSTVMRA